MKIQKGHEQICAEYESRIKGLRALIREIETQGHKVAGYAFISGIVVGVIIGAITVRIIQCMF